MSKPRKQAVPAAPIFPVGMVFEKRIRAVLEPADAGRPGVYLLRHLDDDGKPSARAARFDWQRVRDAGWMPAVAKVRQD